MSGQQGAGMVRHRTVRQVEVLQSAKCGQQLLNLLVCGRCGRVKDVGA